MVVMRNDNENNFSIKNLHIKNKASMLKPFLLIYTHYEKALAARGR